MSLHVEAPSVRVRGEHRLAVDTWDELQLRLERITGIPPEAQRLELDGAPLESIHRLAPGHTLRVLDALQTDELCPCNWKKGEETLHV